MLRCEPGNNKQRCRVLLCLAQKQKPRAVLVVPPVHACCATRQLLTHTESQQETISGEAALAASRVSQTSQRNNRTRRSSRSQQRLRQATPGKTAVPRATAVPRVEATVHTVSHAPTDNCSSSGEQCDVPVNSVMCQATPEVPRYKPGISKQYS